MKHLKLLVKQFKKYDIIYIMSYVLERLDSEDKKESLEFEKQMKETEKYKEDFMKNAEKYMNDSNLFLEDMSKDELKELFPEYDPDYDYSTDVNNISSFDINIVHNRLSKAFEKIIYKLYKFIQFKYPNYTSYQLVREFIGWHHNRKYGDLHTLFNMNPELYLAHITTSKREIDEIKKQGLKMFMSTKCVNRTNGCFDYVNPLLFEEWAHIHNIILYYYYHYI